ncbi:MAG TPA: T9SS type A sorting domain-containing protein [Hanamia sp.]|nr:T9SS type A sorting domain-containing protein [Hanamia sp.]
MKKTITISVALLLISFMSFAQSANTGIDRDYTFANNSDRQSVSGLERLKMTVPENSFTYSSPVKEEKVTASKNEVVVISDLAHANHKVTITDLSEPSNIRICNYTGRLIQQVFSTGNSIQINNLQKGIYFVQIIGMKSGSSSVKKFSIIN